MAVSHSILDRVGLSRESARAAVANALSGSDDGELYLEYAQSEGLVFDNGRLKSASFDTSQGFGLSAVAGEAAGYDHSGEISEGAIARAGEAVPGDSSPAKRSRSARAAGEGDHPKDRGGARDAAITRHFSSGLCACPLHHASHGPPPPQRGGGIPGPRLCF